MTDQGKTSDLHDRLNFVGLDGEQRRGLAALQPVIASSIEGAIDTFYGKASRHPHTSKFFADPAHIDHAKRRQAAHWKVIASGKYEDDYVNGVTTVGRVHARIGLEPRWYIGAMRSFLTGSFARSSSRN
ncbi:protoglobin domain-containing protein [Rhizobium halophilum]|nr:protoglobin domain-containing protein [Rhizobium halophilum]